MNVVGLTIVGFVIVAIAVEIDLRWRERKQRKDRS